MERIGKNFHKDQIGMHDQFTKLKKILKILDEELYLYLESVDSLSLFYCYRWILVAFKREFPLSDIYPLWEAWFSDYYHEELHLFIIIGMLISNRNIIIDDQMYFDEILAVILLNTHNIKLFATKSHPEFVVDHCISYGVWLHKEFQEKANHEQKLDIFG